MVRQASTGVRSWRQFEIARSDNDPKRAIDHARKAAKWYSAAVRARPSFSFGRSPRFPFIAVSRFHRSPILHANTYDAHHHAGHRWRELWHDRQFHRSRRRLISRGEKQLGRGDWKAAFAYYDWTIAGRQDLVEFRCASWAACLLWKSGDRTLGDLRWEDALGRNPIALLARSELRERLIADGRDEGLPGSEPFDADEMDEFIVACPQLWEGVAPLAALPVRYPDGERYRSALNTLMAVIERFPPHKRLRRLRRRLQGHILPWHCRRRPWWWSGRS